MNRLGQFYGVWFVWPEGKLHEAQDLLLLVWLCTPSISGNYSAMNLDCDGRLHALLTTFGVSYASGHGQVLYMVQCRSVSAAFTG